VAAVTSPRTFFVVGVPGSNLAAVAAWFNTRDDAFALIDPHQRDIAQLADGCEKVQPFWDSLRCRDCPGKAPVVRKALDIFPHFVVPVTEAHFTLGGYVETWLSEELDYRLLVRNMPRADFWAVVTGGDEEYSEAHGELLGIARAAGGALICGDRIDMDMRTLMRRVGYQPISRQGA